MAHLKAEATAVAVPEARRPATIQENLAAVLQKQRERYTAEVGTAPATPGGPAWEIDEAAGRFVCHVTRCVYTTAGQLLAAMRDPRWAADLAVSGLVANAADLPYLETLRAARQDQAQARRGATEMAQVLRQTRHYGTALGMVAKKAAETCLQESGKWPKSLERLCEHCNTLIPILQGLPQTFAEVVAVIELHNVCCAFTGKVYGGDTTWPETATAILAKVAEVDGLLAPLTTAPEALGGPRAGGAPAAPPGGVVTFDPKRAVKAKNRALGYIFRFKKLLKRALPLCAGSQPGWERSVQELQTLLEDIQAKHVDLDPSCEEQQWLDRLQAETRAFADAALQNDAVWTELARNLASALVEVEVKFPCPLPQPPAHLPSLPSAPVMMVPPTAAVAIAPRGIVPTPFPLPAVRPLVRSAGAAGITIVSPAKRLRLGI